MSVRAEGGACLCFAFCVCVRACVWRGPAQVVDVGGVAQDAEALVPDLVARLDVLRPPTPTLTPAAAANTTTTRSANDAAAAAAAAAAGPAGGGDPSP